MSSSALTDGVDPDYPLAPVPMDKRRSTASIMIVIIGFLFFTPTMLAGGQVAVGFSFGEYLIWAAVSAAVLGAYIAVLSLIAGRTGLAPVLLARLVFGKIGGKWASLLLGGTQIGWYGITIAVLGTIMGSALGWETTWPIVVIGGLVMAVTAYYGIKGIELLSWISVPLMLVLCLWVTSRALGETGGFSGLFETGAIEPMTVGTALTIMIATFISGGTQMGNWTRVARSGRIALVTTFFAVFAIQFAMLFFGGVGAAAYGIADFADLLLHLGLIGAGVVLLVFNLWTTNDNAAYAFGVAGAELFGKADKRPFVLGGVAIGILLAVTGIADGLTAFLVLLGVMIPPLGGAMIGYYFFVWKGKAPDVTVGDEPLVRPGALGAYLIGVIVAAVGTALDLGVPAIQGVVVAVIAAPVCAAIEKSLRGSSAQVG